MNRLNRFWGVFKNDWKTFWFSGRQCAHSNVFRIAHSLSLFCFLIFWWFNSSEWLSSKGFHSPNELISPISKNGLIYLACLQFSALIFLIIGWKIRFMAALTCLFLILEALIDQPSNTSINSIYIFSFSVMAIFPNSRHKLSSASCRLLQVGLVAVYFSSGLHKIIFGSWLDSASTLRWMMRGVYTTQIGAFLIQITPSFVFSCAQISVICFELFCPILFFTKGLRTGALVFGSFFHILIGLCMYQFVFFSIQMLSFYILFVSSLPLQRWLEAR